MKKAFLILSGIALLIGGVFFYDQVLAIFKGMSVLEAMKFIVTFVLHVVVVTICMYTLYTLPEIVGPWLKTLRWKRRAARRNRSQPKPVIARSPKLTTDMLLREYMLKQALPKTGRGNPAPTPQDEVRLDF
jgi:hypothetical protein